MLKRWFGSWFSSEGPVYNDYLAVIIGICNPIGQAIALQCILNEGINIAIVDIESHKSSLSKLHQEFKANASQISSVQIESFCIQDLNDLNQINDLISGIKNRFKTNSIQFLFNNIDILMLEMEENIEIPKILTLDSSQRDINNDRLHHMMDLNFWSILNITRSFLPLLDSKENIESNKQCFIVNTSSLKSGYCLSDTMYSVTKYCMHALSELIKYQLIDLNSNRNNKNNIKLKIICPGFVKGNDRYNLLNASNKYDNLQSIDNMKLIIEQIEISIEEFGKIIFDGIRNENIFNILSHLKIFRIYASDKLISMYKPQETRHLFTKRLHKSILSKL